MKKSKVMIYYTDGCTTKITCPSQSAQTHVVRFLNDMHVKKITSHEYPLKDNKLVVHKDVKEAVHD